jgi:hypothetical protein
MVFFFLLFPKKNRNKHEDGESYCPKTAQIVWRRYKNQQASTMSNRAGKI